MKVYHTSFPFEAGAELMSAVERWAPEVIIPFRTAGRAGRVLSLDLPALREKYPLPPKRLGTCSLYSSILCRSVSRTPPPLPRILTHAPPQPPRLCLHLPLAPRI